MSEHANTGERLRSFVERIERVEEDLAGLSEDRKEIYAEAKGEGFDASAIRKIVSDRKKDAHQLNEFEAILDLYKSAIGDLPTKKEKVKDSLS